MMMNQQGGAGSMSDALGQQPQMPTSINPGFMNPASMSPAAMANMQGSPLANAGANMNQYMGVQQQMFPNMEKGGGMAGGGLVRFAEGGMPPMPPQEGQDPAAGAGGPPPQLGQQEPQNEWQGQAGDELVQKVEQIFQENLQDPKKIGQLLLQLVEEELKKVLSPEQLQQLQTPEGEEMLQQMVQQIMQQMHSGQGGLGQLAQMAGQGGGEVGGGPPAGGPPPGGGGALGQMAGQG